MGLFSTAICDDCGEKSLKSKLKVHVGPEGDRRLCPGCLELATMKAMRIEEHKKAWEGVRQDGGCVLIEGAAVIDATWQDLPEDMIALEHVMTLLEELPITDPRRMRLSNRPFALEESRRALQGSDLFDRDPDFLSQVVDAYSLEDLVDEAAGVLLSFCYEKVVTIQFIGDVDLAYKEFVHDKPKGKLIVSAHYMLALGSKVSTAGGGIERPVKRMVLSRAGENRYVWCKLVDRD